MTKIWIIGANGMLGKAVLSKCQEKNIAAIGTGKVDGDILNPSALEARAREILPTHIINCAAYTDVDGAENAYTEALSINAVGAQHVAEIAKRFSCRFIHISSDYVFDGARKISYGEGESLNPVNLYGKSKAEAEKRIFPILPEACVIRTSWLFGSGGKNFLSSLRTWLMTKEAISVVSDQWGCLTYVPDLAEAILSLLNKSGIFHFANRGVVSRYDVAKFMEEEMQRLKIPMTCKNIQPVSKDNFPTVAPRPMYSVLGTEKLSQMLGKEPRSWKECVSEFLSHA